MGACVLLSGVCCCGGVFWNGGGTFLARVNAVLKLHATCFTLGALEAAFSAREVVGDAREIAGRTIQVAGSGAQIGMALQVARSVIFSLRESCLSLLGRSERVVGNTFRGQTQRVQHRQVAFQVPFQSLAIPRSHPSTLLLLPLLLATASARANHGAASTAAGQQIALGRSDGRHYVGRAFEETTSKRSVP